MHGEFSAKFIDDICDAFEAAWQNGDLPDPAEWLMRADPELRTELKIQLARVDLEYWRKTDPEFSIGTYLQRHGLRIEDVVAFHSNTDTETVALVDRKQDSPVPKNGVAARPRFIGRFEIRKELGRGGFGIVYQAFDTALKRIVALKIPRDELNEQSRKRFLREAEATAALDHPGLVPVFESGEADGQCYIATAYCSGPNLSQWIEQQDSIPIRQSVLLVRHLAEAMQHAHDRGVVHRDLKPSNIMAVPGPVSGNSDTPAITPRITDFGLAKLLEQRLQDTQTSVVLGTPSYMAPEQLAGRDSSSLSPATDIYSLGVIFYQLLTGRRPFEGKTVVNVMDAIRNDAVPGLRKTRTDLPRELETICLKCLAKTPADRYAACAELAGDLSRFLQGQTIIARPPGFRERVQRWGNDPARIHETGLLSILLGLGIPVWIILVMVLVKIEGLKAQVEEEMIPQTLMLTCMLLLPLAWIGHRTLQRSRLWIRVGFGVSIVNVLMVSPPLFGHVLVFPDLYNRYPLGRIVAYTVLTLMFSVQVLQYAVALRLPVVRES